ncbi:hypothetical protein ACFO3C_21200 [Halostagnicola sp. GCM10023398]|uniref:hypothetical protein n=1 Tax=Halostagnicola sp. GCM10023398 TaxID=3252683 RepID=UPI0036160D92
MHIVLEVVFSFALESCTPFGPRFAAVIADVNAANFHASDNAVGCIRMNTKASNV